MTVWTTRTVTMVIVGFFAQGQAGKDSILQKTFLVRHQSGSTLGDVFFHPQLCRHTVSREFIWRTYTTAQVLQTTKQVKLFNLKEFSAVALEAYGEAWYCIWHLLRAWSQRSKMFILFTNAPILFIHKKNDNLWLCVWGFNNLTMKNRFAF